MIIVVQHNAFKGIDNLTTVSSDGSNLCDTRRMQTTTTPTPYKGFRFPKEIISHAVWLYFRFSLSFRDVEERLAERGVIVSYETVRQWSRKFGQSYAHQLRRRRAKPGDKWFLLAVPVQVTRLLLNGGFPQGNPCLP